MKRINEYTILNMFDLNPLIHPLIGNHNALSSDTLEEWIHDGQATEAELRSILPSQMVDDFMHAPRPQRVGPGATRLPNKCQEEDFTEVYFWGLRHSGKSTIIASIIAAQPESITAMNATSGKERAQQQVDIYAKEGNLIHFPYEDGVGETNASNVTRVDLRTKDGKGFRRYPMALIECAAGKDGIDIENTLYPNSQREQIHILCWDPDSKNKDQQEEALVRLLETLRDKGLLDRTVGIYLVVTKVDRYSVIDHEYQNQIAQQIIISEHPTLWAVVKNLAYRVGVYGMMPIPFSVGDVFLQNLVKVNLQSARSLINDQLLLKCQPAASLPERILTFGSLGLTIFLVLALCAGIGYSAKLAFANISSPPEQEIKAFDYQEYFLELERKQVRGRKFDRCYRKFLNLEQDLKTEKFVRERGSNRRIFVQSGPCEETLYNDYGKIVHNRNLEEFVKTQWNTYDYMLAKTNSILNNSALHSDVRADLEKDTTTIHDFKRAKNLIYRSKHCRYLSSVRTALEEARQYNYYPVINDETIKEGLGNVPYEAYNSYAAYIKRRVNARLYDQRTCEAYRDTLKMLRGVSGLDPDIQQNISETFDKIESRYPSRRFIFW